MFYWSRWFILACRHFYSQKAQIINPDYSQFEAECAQIVSLLPTSPKGFDRLLVKWILAEISRHEIAARTLHLAGLTDVVLINK